jgi:two-component system cell cycle sensor histidine kinase/response regulator CckA
MEEERRRIERLESLGTLAGGIAHDFNNLLTGIMGNISLIRDYLEPGSKEAERLLEAERASLRAKDLTQQLLTFARGGEPIKETVAVGGLIEDAANFALGGSKSACVFDIPENLWQAHADKGQMSEVVNNLVINADEAMPGGGMINISARNRVFREESSLFLPKGDYIELSIEDHGVGIPEEDFARIYEPYFTTKAKGSGLGLATTYSIIKNHEGLITVDSTPGVGTTFHVYLPATRKSLISFEEEAEDILSSLTGKILIMDDEEAIRRLLERALTEAGHDITTAKDGTEAIEQYVGARERGQPFDLVILDLTVPGGMGGVEAMAKLLEIDPDIKSIVSSGYSSDPIMADYEKYGFGAVIAKPYRVHELRRMILKILQQK